MKIIINAPCPCGSGKKYKKCCYKTSQDYKETTENESRESTNPFFQKYNSFDLLKSIVALTLIPENHGKNVRLELLSDKVFQNYNSKIEIASPNILKTFLDNEYPSNYLEDPPVNLFTDLIPFYGGDYIIFPGITETGSFILSNLLSAIYHWPNSNIPDSFKNNCSHFTLLMLSISNIIAKRIGSNRYQKGEAQELELYIPDNALFKSLKDAVVFSEEEINLLMKENSISKHALFEFLININSLDYKDRLNEESPLIYRPIFYTDSKYLIVSPATLSFALTYRIWVEAERLGCMKEVNDAYHSVLWNNIQLQLSQMNFIKSDVDCILSETNLPIKDGKYLFDDDKIAYIQFVYDSGANFLNKERTNILVAHVSTEAYKSKTIARIFSMPEFAGFQIFDFTIISSIGRDFNVLNTRIKDTRTIEMSVFEFDVLSNLRDTNGIDLWKYTIAVEEQNKVAPFISYSLLDTFNIFKENNDSFYVSDETKNVDFYIQPGYSAEMVKESMIKTDIHSVSTDGTNSNAKISVERMDKYAPIYVNKSQIVSNKLKFVIEGFYHPIWVSPKSIPEGASQELKHIFWVFNDAIAYWLWQIQDDCKEDLKGIDNQSLLVTFEFNPINKFESIERNFTRVLNLSNKFQTSASKSSINIVIPSEINSYLYGPDNEGERILVKHLLLGINKLISYNNQTEIIDERISKIIESKVPLGMKKKLFILDTNDNLLLDPRYLPRKRYVQNYDIELLLNSIVPELGRNCPDVGEITTKEEKEKLTMNVVMKVLLPKLKKTIIQYDSRKLLEKLIGLNESLIKKREHLRILTPTRIACYVSVDQHAIDLRKTLSKINRTTLATRCLIEHIAAEPTSGAKIISTTAIDELLALMDQIISWSSLCDQVKYSLFDIKMGILPSGRIGTEKTSISEVFDPYYASKTVENISDSIKSYEQVFPQQNQQNGKDTPVYLNKAFFTDFGISFDRICEFIDGLANVGIQQQAPFSVLSKNSLKKEINKDVKPFEDLEFENAIIYLSLFERGKVENIPSGYDSFDISPWRFNRRLSLLRKPLIAINNESDKNNPLIYWGFRQVLSSKIYLADQIISGRLKVSENGQVIKAIGKIVQERGNSLVRKVFEKLKSNNVIIDKEVPISPNHELHDSNDLGDIDILLIDTLNKILFSLECKSISPSRNIKEMVEEVSKLLGSDTQKGWIQKHLIRDKWIKNNISLIGTKYGIDLASYNVKSLFITEEDMLTPHLKKQSLPLPFVTRYELEKEGIDILIRK